MGSYLDPFAVVPSLRIHPMLKKLLALLVVFGFVGLFIGCAEEKKPAGKDAKPATDKKDKDAKKDDKKPEEKKPEEKKPEEKKPEEKKPEEKKPEEKKPDEKKDAPAEKKDEKKDK
jgi:outer membrane biosynthesis protein TonB